MRNKGVEEATISLICNKYKRNVNGSHKKD